jgi:GPH family glycoside/pentoside/hexuronide:cation symporter
MTADAPRSAAPAARRLRPGTVFSYGFGSVAYGVKDSGFGTFLLLFYNQVVGLPAATVGLVVMAALILDAFIDPAIGALSDRTRSRWGRRHPWLYASAVPIALGWIALWNPPALSPAGTLAWLFVTAVAVRSAVSAYEVPSQALTPELTGDYDERTRITAYRYLFGWAGGLLMLLLAYRVFLAPAPGYPNGLLRPDGYSTMSVVAALLMAGAILVSALGTHREIPNLPRPEIARIGLGDHFRQLAETMRNRAFVTLMLAGVCAYTNQGISYALSNYLYSYVWQFGGAAFGLLPLTLMAGVVLAFFFAPRAGARFGKPRAATVAVATAMVLHTSPYWLRFLGLMPAPGDPRLVPILFSIFIFATACGVSGFIIGASMMADVVEDSEARTGRRSEGVFFAGSFFVQKCTSGIGIFAAGLILSLAQFPEAAKPGQVPIESIDRLTGIFIAVYLTLGGLAAFLFTRFPFGRAEHEARLARLVGAPGMNELRRDPD